MRMHYDPEGDVLEVIFNEQLHRQEKKAFKLREGIILYLNESALAPVQLTLVNYKKAAQLPALLFNGWQKLTKSEQKKLLPVLTASPVSAFLQIDPRTGYGHLSRPEMFEILSVA